MAGVGSNGSITTYPGSGEKIRTGCNFWCGARKVIAGGAAAQTFNGNPARCAKKGKEVYPNTVCTCSPNSFQKWNSIK